MSKRNGHLQLRPDPQNARRHPGRNKEMIRASLKEIGAFRSIAVDGDNIVRAGNGVFEQAEALGLKVRVIDARPDELIAVRRPDLKGKKAVRAALLDNRAGELSEWDVDVLAEIPGDALASLWTEVEWSRFGAGRCRASAGQGGTTTAQVGHRCGATLGDSQPIAAGPGSPAALWRQHQRA
ncbi:MAG TPA: hypothetical protein VJG32_17900 [Anaerolineae bacterium]|nr:hypothetical protein [Anaerolineae bacterium]